MLAIESFDTPGASQFLIQGTKVAQGAGSSCQVLNELCTNAVEYGAMSVLDGRVNVAMTLTSGTQTVRLARAETVDLRCRRATALARD